LRDEIDDLSKLLLIASYSRLCTLLVVDVDTNAAPSYDLSGFIQQRRKTDPEPPELSIEAAQASLCFQRLSRRDRSLLLFK